MSGFYVLAVPEFASLIDAAVKSGAVQGSSAARSLSVRGVRERDRDLAPRHLHERGGLVRMPDRRTRRQDRAFRFAIASSSLRPTSRSWASAQRETGSPPECPGGHAYRRPVCQGDRFHCRSDPGIRDVRSAIPTRCITTRPRRRLRRLGASSPAGHTAFRSCWRRFRTI